MSITRLMPAGILVFVAAFVAVGAGFIPKLAPQQDEALFTPVALEGPCGLALGIEIAGRHIPLMEMSYVGALKGWLYKPIFAIWKPSVWSMRVPALVTGAAAIAVTAWVLTMATGPVAGFLVAALLATDAAFLLLTTFDWGPVALQQLLIALTAAAFLRYQRTGGAWAAFASGLCIGLAIWNKAIAVWFLTGIGVAIVTCYPRAARAILKPRPAAVAVLGILLGAAPLLVFNVTSGWLTIRENASVEKPDWGQRVEILRLTLDGTVMSGFLFPELPDPDSIRRGFRSGLFLPAVLAAILAGLVLARRPTFFLLIAAIVSWIFMVSSRGGGAGHHTILLAPAPHALVAIAAARVLESRFRAARAVTALGCAAVVIAGCLVIQRYRVASRLGSGAGPGWTNAIFGLATELDATYPDRWVVIADWGLYNNLCFLAPRVHFAGFDADPSVMTQVIGPGDGLAVRGLGDQHLDRESAETLIRHAASMGKQMRVLATIRDSRGDPKYEILDFY